MFLLTFLILNTGRTPQELETTVFQAASIAQKHNCQLTRLDWQQEQGLMSSLPLAHNMVEAERALTTSSTAIFIPFTDTGAFPRPGKARSTMASTPSQQPDYGGPQAAEKPQRPDSGHARFRQIIRCQTGNYNAFLSTDDDIIVCDPEAEVRHEVA